MSRTDTELMQLALAVARKGGRAVRPNPLVGCAIETQGGDLILGYHEKYGEGHAERNAVNEARRQGVNLSGARIAVTLEPCAHVGKTGACAELLAEEKWAEVIVGVKDPFPQVAGKGIARLQAAGLPVKVGILESECRQLNRYWLRAHELGRAHVTMKMGTSLDGKWTSNTGDSVYITSEAARHHAHVLRTRFDAVITSGETVRVDNPALTARTPAGELREAQPYVYVLTKKGLSLAGRKLEKHPKGAEVVTLSGGLSDFLKKLLEKGHFDVLIEAGPVLCTAFLEQGLVDEVHCYLETNFLGGAEAHHFSTPFNGGKLPGLPFRILRTETLADTSLFLNLVK